MFTIILIAYVNELSCGCVSWVLSISIKRLLTWDKTRRWCWVAWRPDIHRSCRMIRQIVVHWWQCLDISDGQRLAWWCRIYSYPHQVLRVPTTHFCISLFTSYNGLCFMIRWRRGLATCPSPSQVKTAEKVKWLKTLDGPWLLPPPPPPHHRWDWAS